MKRLISDLEQLLQRQQPVAYTALVETRGSTPQKAGASMLVYPDGSQSGTLGGGCVEAEVKKRALQLLDRGETEILTFQLDSDYGWDDGLICGGRMKMLVDPIRPDQEAGYFRELIGQFGTGLGCTEVVVIDPDAAGGGAVGDRLLFDADDRLVASRGSGSLPARLMEQMRPVRTRPRPYVSAGMSFLPHLQRCRLLIVGAGHVGQKVAELAHAVDFDVWIVDDREEYCNPDRFPNAKRLIVAPIDQALSGLEIDNHTLALIVTRGHNHDEEALYHLAESGAGYVGLIGSKRKIKLILEDLLREGISPEALENVYAPIGFDIGSQTVPEIAISVVAELIAHRNLGAIPPQFRARNPLDEVRRTLTSNAAAETELDRSAE